MQTKSPDLAARDFLHSLQGTAGILNLFGPTKISYINSSLVPFGVLLSGLSFTHYANFSAVFLSFSSSAAFA